MSEQPISPQSPPALRPLARTQEWVRRAVSPWAQRLLAGRLQRRPDRASALAGNDSSRLSARLQRRAMHRPAWSAHTGTLSPNMVDRFAGAVAGRFALPGLSRFVDRPFSSSGRSPMDMPLVGSGPTPDLQPAVVESMVEPAVESDGLAATLPPAGLPPLGARWAGGRASASPAPPATSAANPVTRARPPLVSGEPRPTAGRIRRYARVEEIDPAALAAENERRPKPPPSMSEPPAKLPDTARSAELSDVFDPARATSIQRSLEREPVALPSQPLPSDKAQSGSSPARVAPPDAQSPTPGMAGKSPPASAEQPSVSVLQRLRQARAAQLHRKAEQSAPAMSSTAPASLLPAATRPDTPSSNPATPPAATTGMLAVSPRTQPQPSLRRAVELPTEDEVPLGEQKAAATSPTQTPDAAPTVRDVPEPSTTSAQELAQEPTISAPTRMSGETDLADAPLQAAEVAAPSLGERPASAAPAQSALASPARSPAVDLMPDDVPARREQVVLPESPLHAGDVPAGQPSLSGPSIQRAVEEDAGEDAGEVRDVSGPAQPALATIEVEPPPVEPSEQDVAAAFARRVVSRVGPGARLPVSLNRLVAGAPDRGRRAVRREPQQQEAVPGTGRPVARRQSVATPGEPAQPPVAPQVSAGAAEFGEARLPRADDEPAARAPAVLHVDAQAAGLPVLRRRGRVVAARKWPAVLPQARVSGRPVGSEGVDDSGSVDAGTTRQRAPTDVVARLPEPPQMAGVLPAARPFVGVRRSAVNSARPVAIGHASGVERDEPPDRGPWSAEANRPTLPLAAPARAPRVQRAVEHQPASPATVAPREPAQTGPAGAPDLQALARRVYPILKRMLAVERERIRGA